MNFQDEFKIRRSVKRITQVQAAKICGVSTATIRNWEQGVSEPEDKAGLLETLKNAKVKTS